jgi:hypothetical protein
MILNVHRLIGVSILVGGAMGLCLPSVAQQPTLPHPEQIAQQLPPPMPPPTPEQAMQADQRQGDYFDVDGARIFYQVAGSGTPLLLIHGFPLSGQLYRLSSRGSAVSSK